MGTQGEMSPSGSDGWYFGVFSSYENTRQCVRMCLSRVGVWILQMGFGITAVSLFNGHIRQINKHP